MTGHVSAGAAWLPSRFNLAAFRLLGLFVARAKRDTRLETVTVLQFVRHQHPLEFYSVALAFLVLPTLHAWALIREAFGWPVLLTLPLFLVLPFAVVLAWDLVVFSVAALLWLIGRVVTISASRNKLQSLVTHLAMILIAIAAIAGDWPTRWLGVVWLALVAFNAIAWLLLFALRRPVQQFSDGVTGQV